MKYTEIVEHLESLGVMPRGRPSIQPTKKALEALGLALPKPERVIVVAGTNGKGSVCATLEALLLSAGCSVGLYTSPHLIRTTERIRVNGREISELRFSAAFESVRDTCHTMELSHFEWLTLMAATIFSEDLLGEKTYWILEVGMGGSFDATNAFEHSINVVTRLGIDHENWLGRDLLSIARNKFGIVRAGVQVKVVTWPLNPEIEGLKKEVQDRAGCEWIEVFDRADQDEGGVVRDLGKFGRASLNLVGRRGKENTQMALEVFNQLGFDSSQHLDSLSRVNWPGRFQKIEVEGARCPVYFSGDHNVQGIHSLIEILDAYSSRHLWILLGIGEEKASSLMFEALKSGLGQRPWSFALTKASFKGRAFDQYDQQITRQMLFFEENSALALARVIELAQPEDLVLVTGSLYLVGELLKRCVV